MGGESDAVRLRRAALWVELQFPEGFVEALNRSSTDSGARNIVVLWRLPRILLSPGSSTLRPATKAREVPETERQGKGWKDCQHHTF